MNKALFLAVKPFFAEMILNGEKTVELRRQRPSLEPGDYLIVYATSPLKSIVGAVVVQKVVAMRLRTLWTHVRDRSGLSYGEFCDYFDDLALGHAIFLGRPARLVQPVTLEMLRAIQPGFSPQGYRYYTRRGVTEALARLRLSPMVG